MKSFHLLSILLSMVLLSRYRYLPINYTVARFSLCEKRPVARPIDTL